MSCALYREDTKMKKPAYRVRCHSIVFIINFDQGDIILNAPCFDFFQFSLEPLLLTLSISFLWDL